MKTAKTNEIPWCPKLRGGTDNIWFPAYVQIKIDGEYNLIHYSGKTNEIYSVNKNGLKRWDYPAINAIKFKINNSKWCDKEITLIAELYYGEGKNNDLYKLLANKKSDDLNLYVHDFMLPNKDTVDRIKELELLSLIEEGKEIWYVHNNEQLEGVYVGAFKRGYEGVVVKPEKATLAMAQRWVKIKNTDETHMQVVDLCPGQERIELKHEGGTVGAKCPEFVKRTLSLGDKVLVKHFGFLSGGGVRNPIIIKEAV
jgi:hypothetical protein